MGRTTHFYYTDEKQLMFTVSAMGAIVQYTYDSFEKVTQIRRYKDSIEVNRLPSDASGFVCASLLKQFEALQTGQDEIIGKAYNQRGLMIRYSDGNQYTTIRTYNAFKQLESEQKPIGGRHPTVEIITHRYDVRGHQTKREKNDGKDTLTQIWEHNNPLGKETKHVDLRKGVHEKSYDRRGLLVRHTAPLDKTVTLTHFCIRCEGCARSFFYLWAHHFLHCLHL